MEDTTLLDALPTSKTKADLDAEAAQAARAQADEANTARDEEVTRLRALAQQYAPFDPILEAVRQDPSKMYDIRAALEGKYPAQSTPTQSAPSTSQGLTQEQIDALNAKAMENPAEFIVAAADARFKQGIAEFLKQAQPALEATGDSFVESFKNRKSSSDPLYKQIATEFDREMADLSRSAILNVDAKTRNGEFERRWDAASGRVFRRAMNEDRPRDNAPNMGNGGGGGGTVSTSTKPSSRALAYLNKHPELVALAKATGAVSREEMEAIANRILEENENG